jgi:arginase
MQIEIIGVPVDLGAGRRGVDMGPRAIRYAGLAEQLGAVGHTVVDHGNIAVPLAEQIEQPQPGERLRYLAPLLQINRDLTHRVATICKSGAFPLILGGDHSLAIGSVRGVAAGRKLGLIWIDAHGDFNTDQTTPSGNIHGMSLAALAGRGHTALAQPTIAEANIALVGARDLDPAEREALRASGVHIFTMLDLDRRGMAAVID